MEITDESVRKQIFFVHVYFAGERKHLDEAREDPQLRKLHLEHYMYAR